MRERSENHSHSCEKQCRSSFVLWLGSGLFFILGWVLSLASFESISMFSTESRRTTAAYLRQLGGFPKGDVQEWWAISNLVVAGLAWYWPELCRASPCGLRLLTYWLIIRGAQLFVKQVNVLLFDRHRSLVRGERSEGVCYPRLALLLLVNYIEVIWWFAAYYRSFYPYLTKFAALRASSARMIGFGPALEWTSTLTNVPEFLQSALGLFMTILILSRFVALLPAGPGRN